MKRERDAGEMETKVIEYTCVNKKYIRSSTTYMDTMYTYTCIYEHSPEAACTLSWLYRHSVFISNND